jgi:hypothetical protein
VSRFKGFSVPSEDDESIGESRERVKCRVGPRRVERLEENAGETRV